LSDREGYDFDQIKSIAKVQVGIDFHFSVFLSTAHDVSSLQRSCMWPGSTYLCSNRGLIVLDTGCVVIHGNEFHVPGSVWFSVLLLLVPVIGCSVVSISEQLLYSYVSLSA
jgi:hypothetical protein